MFGNHGRILKVNLSSREVTIETRDEAYYRMFLGGNGLCAGLIHESVPGDADGFDP